MNDKESLYKLFREAVIDELVCAHIYNSSHDDNPAKAIKDVIDWNVEVALDARVSNSAAAIKINELNKRLEAAQNLLLKHGICDKCGELYEHDYDGPFASCKCGTSEWYNLTPHMTKVSKALASAQQTTVNERDFWRERYNEIKSACEEQFHGHSAGTTNEDCKICCILSKIEAMNL